VNPQDPPAAEPAPPAPGAGTSAGPTAQAPARTNRVAIAALVTDVAGLVLFAVGFAVTAPVQTRRRHKKGKALAISALAASPAWLAAMVVIGFLTVPGSTESADPVRKYGEPQVSTRKVGDCFTGFARGVMRIFAIGTPCTHCTARAAALFGFRPRNHVLATEFPTDRLEWARGQRHAICLLQAEHGLLTHSVMPK
jgi:hypothetical protein